MTDLKPLEDAQADGNGKAAMAGIAPRPLRVAGVVVRKRDLIEALRPYVPTIRDLQVTEDGEHYWLMLDGGDENEHSAAG